MARRNSPPLADDDPVLLAARRLLSPDGLYPGLPKMDPEAKPAPTRDDLADVLWDRLMEHGLPGQFAWAWSLDLADTILDRFALVSDREYGTVIALSQTQGRLASLSCGCVWDEQESQFAALCELHADELSDE